MKPKKLSPAWSLEIGCARVVAHFARQRIGHESSNYDCPDCGAVRDDICLVCELQALPAKITAYQDVLARRERKARR